MNRLFQAARASVGGWIGQPLLQGTRLVVSISCTLH